MIARAILRAGHFLHLNHVVWSVIAAAMHAPFSPYALIVKETAGGKAARIRAQSLFVHGLTRL